MNERYQAENLNSKKLLEKEPDLVRPNLCKKPVFAMIIAHLCSNNCFFILFNWLPALVIKKLSIQEQEIHSLISGRLVPCKSNQMCYDMINFLLCKDQLMDKQLQL